MAEPQLAESCRSPLDFMQERRLLLLLLQAYASAKLHVIRA
jgi:hypothetical protein